jgi:hypothetical protein
MQPVRIAHVARFVSPRKTGDGQMRAQGRHQKMTDSVAQHHHLFGATKRANVSMKMKT